MPKVLIKRGTRTQLNTARDASWLNAGELYLITDEAKVAVGTAANAYSVVGASLSVGTTAPTAATAGNLWFNSETGELSVYYTDTDTSQWVAVSGPAGPQGPQGLQGETGATGPQGTAGTNGTNGTNGAAGPMGPKALLIQWPTTADTKLSMFFTTAALTVSKLVAVLPGGASTPSCTFHIRHGSDISATGTALITSPSAVTNTSTGTAVTSFNNASISAGSFVWVEVTAVSGTVPALSVTLEFS